MIFSNPVDDLASRINQRGGLARSNFFAITFFGPASVNPNQYLLNALVESASIPGRSISTFEHGSTSQPIKYPYSFINDDVVLTFLVTNDFYMKNIFDKWMKHVVDDETGKIYYRKEYVSDMTITVLDLKADMIYKCTLQDAYPITMNAIELSNTNENGLIRVQVTMTYKNFISKSTYFSLATSVADILDSISIPNPFIPGLPFNPFGDIGDQLQTMFKFAKGEVAGEYNSVMADITDQIRKKINSSFASIVKPYTGSIGSITDQVSGKIKSLFGAGAAPDVGAALSNGFDFAKSLSSATTDFVGGVKSAATTVVDRTSSGIKSLFG
jgi:hypothetical protein